MFQKKKRIKSEKYLEWVRGLPCANCQAPGPSEVHHIKGIGSFSGVGKKASDYLSMPMCAQCHRDFHAGYLFQPGYQFSLIVKTIDRAFQEGIIQIKGRSK